jgi:hypothetical protein
MGFRWRFSGSQEVLGGTVTGWPKLAWGFCHGVESPLGAQTITQFVGLRTEDWNGFDITGSQYHINGTTAVRNINAGTASLSGIQTSLTAGGTAGVSYYHGNTASCNVSTLELSRSSIANTCSFSIRTFSRNTTLPINDYWSSSQFQMEMSQSNMTHAGYTNNDLLTINMPLESLYPLNAICVWWDRLDPVVQICDLAVIRLADRGRLFNIAVTYDPFEAYTASLDISGSGSAAQGGSNLWNGNWTTRLNVTGTLF